VNSISIIWDPSGGDFCVIEIDSNIVDLAGVENNMITLYNVFNDQIFKKYFCK
jgi:aspartate 1-decarboxylase